MKTTMIPGTLENSPGIAEAAQLLREGQLVALPTETVYGLGANGLDEESLGGIYEAKGRPSDNPLILHVASRADVDALVTTISPLEEELMRTFWPGPLTITFPKSSKVPLKATGGLDRVALRCPDHAVCRAIIEAAGVPIAAPSANLSGKPSPTTAKAVWDDMKGRIAAIVDSGPCEVGVESTVVQCEGQHITILRPGGITADMLALVGDSVDYDAGIVDSSVTPLAPGMKYKHYAPTGHFEAYVGNSERIAAIIMNRLAELQNNEKLGLFISEETAQYVSHIDTSRVIPIVYGKAHDVSAMSKAFYDSLHTFDEAGCTHIIGEGTERKGLGVAIMNRMDKATSYQVKHI